jgi:hypothetical protein
MATFVHRKKQEQMQGLNKLKIRSYSAQNGGKKYVTEIIADSFLLLKLSDKAEINASF